MPHRRAAVLAAALLLAFAATAAQAAYTIYLKDGSRLVAQKKYVIVGERAVFTAENGTRSFVAAAEIDVARTDEANRQGYGNAEVLREVPTPAAPPPKPRRSLTDLAARTAPAPPGAPAARREAQRPEVASPKTGSGAVDFMARERRPYPNLEVASELLQLYRGQGVEEVQLFAGTRADRPLVEITTASEASVLQALTASADALLQLRQRHPGKVGALELLMATPARERAGQFVLTPELAAELAAKKVEVTAFFVRNVQF
jgi:hypothetical protein